MLIIKKIQEKLDVVDTERENHQENLSSLIPDTLIVQQTQKNSDAHHLKQSKYIF
jgi:hypothetical protein